MSTVAEQLRAAREGKSLTIHQVAEVTKIRTDHLRALEEGNFNVFSAPVYIRGFVRTYAMLLKLDVAKTMSSLEAELGQTEKFREPPPLTEQTRSPVDFITLQLSRLNWRVTTILLVGAALLLVAVLGIVISRHTHAADPTANLAPAVYHPPPSGETLPLPAPRRSP